MFKLFPTFPVQTSVFYVNSLVKEGGFTLGGVRSESPDPSGIAVLKITPSLIKTERDDPMGSWLLSNLSGEVFIIKILGHSPQIISKPQEQLWANDQSWSNGQPWKMEEVTTASVDREVSENTLFVNTFFDSSRLKMGNIIGHEYNTYFIDEVEVQDNGATKLTIKPPLRKPVNQGDTLFLAPWFTGTVENSDNIRSPYSAELRDNLRLPEIVIREFF